MRERVVNMLGVWTLATILLRGKWTAMIDKLGKLLGRPTSKKGARELTRAGQGSAELGKRGTGEA